MNDDARAEALFASRLETVFGAGAPLIAGVTWAGSVVQGAILWSSSRPSRVLLWVALVTLVEVGSLATIFSFRRARPAPAEMDAWGRHKLLQVAALGLVWGSGVGLLYVPNAPTTLLVPVLTVVAVTTSSTVTNAVFPRGMHVLHLATTLPAIFFLFAFAGDGATERAAGWALLLLLFAVTIGGAVASRVIGDAVLARIDLAAAVEQERALRAETERARAESERAREESEKARLEAERARAESEKARLQAETASAEAEAARAQTALFFSAASHDLRQPLHALGLYSGLLLKEPDETQRRTLVASVESCVDSLERLFNGILGIAEAEILRTQVEPAPVPLMPLLEKVATRFRVEAEEKGLRLRVVRTSLWASTDAGALERILSNLVANAVRYTARGRVVIGVRRRARGCALVVGDTGVGIAQRKQRKIFEAFYQTNNPERDRSKGFGLGLAIVERLCHAVGSRIEVTSVLGRGTLFEVSLERSEPVPESNVVSSDLGGPPSSLRVLLVEDDPLVRDATLRTLQGWHIPVEACATGAEALARIAARPHDRWHVLVDYRLANGESGLSVVDALRAESRHPLAVSMITGEADATLVTEAAARDLPLLVKPLKPLRLRALLASSR